MTNSVRVLKDALTRHVTSRILGFHSVAIAASILCAGHFASREIEAQALSGIFNRTQAESSVLLKDLREAERAGDKKARALALDRFASLKLRLTLYDAAGNILADSDNPHNTSAAGRERVPRAGVPRDSRTGLSGKSGWVIESEKNVAYFVSPLDPRAPKALQIRVAVSPNEIRELRLKIRRRMILWTLALLAALGAASIVSFRVHSRRLRRITSLAEDLSKGKAIPAATAPDSGDLGRIEEALGLMQQTLNRRSERRRDETARFELMLSRMNEGALAVDENLSILSANPAAEKLLQTDDSGLVGRSLIEAVRNPSIEEIARECLRTLKTLHREVEYFGHGPLVLSVNAVPLPHPQGGTAAVLLFYDVTPFRRLEQVLKDFVANASHELKTPLTSIKGFVETLESGMVREESKRMEFLRRIGEDADRMTRLVEDLLDLSRLESGVHAQGKADQADMVEIFAKVITALGPAIREKQIQVHNEFSSPKAAWVKGNPDDLFRAVFNIMDNAVKFNKVGGSITLKASPRDGQWEFEIRDTGIGIPAEALPRIFERFFRADKDRSRARGGTGLGLAITKEIIEAAGGNVLCLSSQSKGTRLQIRLAGCDTKSICSTER